ncbi:DEAD/DEAH box helicase [Clostridium sp. LY3-2]|uniref:DEAD/DEAH box helicase n=1 Tax=Clostridium sp. LY3-2 TaxID=2942482 RepID=UPI002152A8F1|nr:DEAD/DEAH box helicase [Clostridium sp. LY3-2]MCR6514167.1 DEAD/DEAH box helicase [Clostridium sp. LY3-2]
MKNEFIKFKINEKIIKSLDELGFLKPTEVQDKVIGEALLNKDLIVKAKTGSGKTLAFGIPLIERSEFLEETPKTLILAPTRELAIQIKEELSNIGRHKKIKVVSLIGKESFKDQEKSLKDKCQIVVGTPGRVLDHLDRGTLKGSNIKYLVIDEADEMFNMGFISQISGVFRRISKRKVTMIFSATFKDEIKKLSEEYMDRPILIDIKGASVSNEDISHSLVKVEGNLKLQTLNNILLNEGPKRAVVFCRTKDNVAKVYDYLKALGYSVDFIHGDNLQKDRNRKMNSFKDGDYRILVATDIVSRGIDVEDISHVINVDIPVEKEAYVHRIGRTGRNGNKGKSITFVTPFEDKYLDRIEEYIGFNIDNYSDDLDNLPINKANIEVLKSKPLKTIKREKAKSKVMKIYLNGGKKKKIRKIDIVGTVLSIGGITSDDVGVIEINDSGSYVDILNGKGQIVLNELKNKKIKGKTLKVEKAKR